jgi:hypothetical protein
MIMVSTCLCLPHPSVFLQMGPLASGTLSFLQIMFPTLPDDGVTLVNAFVKAVDQLLTQHDIQDMRDDLKYLADQYLRLANALDGYYKLNEKVGSD